MVSVFWHSIYSFTHSRYRLRPHLLSDTIRCLLSDTIWCLLSDTIRCLLSDTETCIWHTAGYFDTVAVIRPNVASINNGYFWQGVYNTVYCVAQSWLFLTWCLWHTLLCGIIIVIFDMVSVTHSTLCGTIMVIFDMVFVTHSIVWHNHGYFWHGVCSTVYCVAQLWLFLTGCL